jgi:prophage antirepressor-like protein
MTSNIDIYNGILRYDNNDIVVVIDDDYNVWFYAKQILNILKYKNSNNILGFFVDPVDRTTYGSIKQFSKYKYNVQDHTIFINEPGLYGLILRSKKKEATQFKKWIVGDVIPSIRKTGKYTMNEKNKNDMENLNAQLDNYKKRVMVLENNQKKEKYPDGGYIYIVKPNNTEKDDLYKIGKVDEKLGKRMNTYNTALPDKVFVVDKVKVNSPIAVELCVKSFLYEYRYRNNKEYYQLDVKSIIKVIHMCNDMICGNKKVLNRSLPKVSKTNGKLDNIYGIFAVNADQKKNDQIGGNNINSHDLYILNKTMYLSL